MKHTHTVIELSPGTIVDTGYTGDRAVCLAYAEIMEGLNEDPTVFYAVISVERDIDALRGHAGLAAAA